MLQILGTSSEFKTFQLQILELLQLSWQEQLLTQRLPIQQVILHGISEQNKNLKIPGHSLSWQVHLTELNGQIILILMLWQSSSASIGTKLTWRHSSLSTTLTEETWSKWQRTELKLELTATQHLPLLGDPTLILHLEPNSSQKPPLPQSSPFSQELRTQQMEKKLKWLASDVQIQSLAMRTQQVKLTRFLNYGLKPPHGQTMEPPSLQLMLLKL